MLSISRSQKIGLIALFLGSAMILSGCGKKPVVQPPINNNPNVNETMPAAPLTPAEGSATSSVITTTGTEGIGLPESKTKLKSKEEFNNLMNNLNSQGESGNLNDVNDSDINNF